MFKWKIVGNIAAVAAMGGVLAYYNFVDKAAESGVEKGNKCPDFTAQTYEVKEDIFSVGEETFTLSAQIGKVCVINFWEVWCQACIEELPEFNAVQEEYGERVEVLAVVGVTSTAESAAAWMNRQGWSAFDKVSNWAEFSLTFAYLPTEICTELGCGGMLPRTVVVDKSGVVAHQQDGAMMYEDLKGIIDTLL